MRDKKLLFSLTKKDFEFQTFRSGGKGGQHQNTRNTGVRIIHKESGARGESREERSQYENKKKAFERLINSDKFKTWHKKKTAEILLGLEKIEEIVEQQMKLENLKIEVIDSQTGKLVEEGDYK